jgi:plasmid stabilization system protein ParE
MKIRYKARAVRHIKAIHDYIAQNDAAAAQRVLQRIEYSINGLLILPFSGRPGVVAGTRILVVPGIPYVVIYRLRQQDVDIIAVLHTARRRRS